MFSKFTVPDTTTDTDNYFSDFKRTLYTPTIPLDIHAFSPFLIRLFQQLNFYHSNSTNCKHAQWKTERERIDRYCNKSNTQHSLKLPTPPATKVKECSKNKFDYIYMYNQLTCLSCAVNNLYTYTRQLCILYRNSIRVHKWECVPVILLKNFMSITPPPLPSSYETNSSMGQNLLWDVTEWQIEKKNFE